MTSESRPPTAGVAGGDWIRVGRHPAVLFTLGAGLLIHFVYHVTRFRLAAVWPLVPLGDASILHDRSCAVFALGDYPARLERDNMDAVFPYSPGAVMLFRGLAALGPAAFMVIWLLLMAGGLVVSMRASLAQERRDIQQSWLLLGWLALVAVGGPVAWDLRMANSNLVYLGTVLAGYGLMRRQPLVGGALIGLSFSIKPYSGLLLLWLLRCGSRRAFTSGVLAIVVLWLAIPAALFGVDGSARLFAGWREQVRIVGDPWVYARLASGSGGPPVVTLRRAVMALTGEGPQAGATQIGIVGLWGIWSAVLAWYARQAWRAGTAEAPSRAALADWTVLLLAPLPFSPWLEPYHAVPLLAGAMLTCVIALDGRTDRTDRTIALAGVACVSMVQLAHLPFSLRGIALLAQFVALTVTLGLLRARLEKAASVR